jgi:hypothetical protein
VELVKDGVGIWSLVEPGPQPADQTAATTAASSLANLIINTTLTTTTDLAPFGVLSPTYRLSVNLIDGRVLAAMIGDKAPTGTTFYVLRDGESTIVTVNSTGLDPIIGLLDNPPVVPPTATPTVAAGTEVTPSVEAPPGDITQEPAVTVTP